MDKWLKRNRAASDDKSSAENPVPSCSTSESDCVVSQEEELPCKTRKVVRRYDPEYINIGFTVTDINNEPRPQCVICLEILSNQSMKPSLLKRHLTTKHSTLTNKHTDYFLCKLTDMKGTKKIMSSFTGSTQKAVQLTPTSPHLFQACSTILPTELIGDERKSDLGVFPGPSEGSVGSAGDNQGTSDDISIPLSPEQYMSEETEPVASGGGGAGCSGPSPHSNSQRPESYKLRHNNHLTLVLESLAGDESFMDVTLTAQGKAIKAHKSVLSAVSPYFRSVLKANPCQHPIIIMPRDIRFEELNNIISYIYKGEMTVAASDLSSLLKTAEVLQVTGLSPSETNSGSCGIMSQVHSFPSSTRVPNMGNNVSHSFSKKQSHKQNQQTVQQQQQPQQQPHQQMEQDNDEDDDDEAMNEDTNDSQERGVDPLDFLNANMTCVKEEIRSDDEAEGEGGGQDIPRSIANISPTHNERESDCVSSNLQNQYTGGSPKPVEDITSKPFNPGEPDEPAIENPSLNDQTVSTPFVCPYCLEVHRPVEMLQSHLRLKHPSKPSFICGCGKVYCRSSTFADHSKKCKF